MFNSHNYWVCRLPCWWCFADWRSESELPLGGPLACWPWRRISGNDSANIPVRIHLKTFVARFPDRQFNKSDYRTLCLEYKTLRLTFINRSEIAHPSIRGRITALQQFMLGIGAFVAGWISYGTYIGLTSTAQWRIPLGLQMLPAVGLGMFT